MSLGSVKSALPDRNARASVQTSGTGIVVPAKRPAPSGSHSETSSLQREEQYGKGEVGSSLEADRSESW